MTPRVKIQGKSSSGCSEFSLLLSRSTYKSGGRQHATHPCTTSSEFLKGLQDQSRQPARGKRKLGTENLGGGSKEDGVKGGKDEKEKEGEVKRTKTAEERKPQCWTSKS